MIDIKNLMLGDIVKYVEEEDDYIARVVGLDLEEKVAYVQVDNKGCGIPCDEEDLESFSITPEILEKNGWVKFRVWYRLRIDDSQYVEYYPHKGRLERIYDHKDGWHDVVFTIAGLNYVHQIQHALRLCGISKEIVL